jgi:hypothetical protein
MNNFVFVICSKECDYIPECVDKIRKIYTNDIIIVDSNSINGGCLRELQKKYTNVTIHSEKNCNYEYGAWVKAFNKYQNKYEAYIFMQDSVSLEKAFDFKELKKDSVLVLHYNDSGWNWDSEAKTRFVNKYKTVPVISDAINITPVPMCIWNSFIVRTDTFTKIINSEIFKAVMPPIDKVESRMWERLWSIIIKSNDIKILPITDPYPKTVTKKEGGRK